MTENKEKRDEKKPLPDDGCAGNKFFVFEKLSIRRSYPINFVLMGVLGDLCLTKINNEIFEYVTTNQFTPLNRVFMCDILPKSEADIVRFIKELYEKCQGYQCLDRYFTKECKQEIERIKKNKSDSTTPDEIDEQLSDCFDKLLASMGDQKLEVRLGKVLTNLGVFLFNNYRVSMTETDIESLFTVLTESYTEMDWIFYLGTPPSKYKEIIDYIKDYFNEKAGEKKCPSGPAKVFLLEKPLQDTSKEARELANYIKKIEKDAKYHDFHFFAVDHYAAKWTLSQLPALSTVPSFSNFIARVDEIIIELLEDKDIPDIRLNYMAKTGLFFDMMPHIILPLQLFFVEKKVTYEVGEIIVGYYKGYDSQIEKWLEKQKKEEKEINIRPETYFNLKLVLTITDTDKKGESQSRKVNVFIRSGKRMKGEQKRVILKQHKGDRVGTVTIDIKGDRFEPNAFSEVSLPPQIRRAEGVSKTIRGHARVLRDVVDYLSSLTNGSEASVNISKVVELLSVENAATIIECIEGIKKSIADWPEKIDKMKEYGKDAIYIDKKKEKKFRFPFE